jgi:hypothetical protein
MKDKYNKLTIKLNGVPTFPAYYIVTILERL